jgi:hypothetical protein
MDGDRYFKKGFEHETNRKMVKTKPGLSTETRNKNDPECL